MISRKTYKQIEPFLLEFIPGHSCKEVSDEILKRYGIEISAENIHCWKKNRHIRSGTRSHNTPDYVKYPREVRDYIAENHRGVSYRDMVNRLRDTFGIEYGVNQIRGFYKNHGFRSGVDTTFKNGHKSPNKGVKVKVVHPNSKATQFKPGHQPATTLPVGTELKRDGYWFVKTDKGSGRFAWKMKHRLIWEAANGPIPEGHRIIFLNGDTDDIRLENLMMITQEAHMSMQRHRLRFPDPELTRSGAVLAELDCQIKRIERDK